MVSSRDPTPPRFYSAEVDVVMFLMLARSCLLVGTFWSWLLCIAPLSLLLFWFTEALSCGCQSVSCLGWRAAWLPGCLAAWLPGCLAAWLPGCLAAWLPGCLAALAACLGCWHVALAAHWPAGIPARLPVNKPVCPPAYVPGWSACHCPDGQPVGRNPSFRRHAGGLERISPVRQCVVTTACCSAAYPLASIN